LHKRTCDRLGISRLRSDPLGFDGRTRKPLDVYTEITGYAISLFPLARTLGAVPLLAMAKEAAQFLMRIQAGSAYPQLSGIAGPARLYAFDTAVCIVGMARSCARRAMRRYLRSAITAGEWLLGMQRPDGSFSAMALDGGGIEDPGGFFGDGSCIHAKNAIAFLELHAITGRDPIQGGGRPSLPVHAHASGHGRSFLSLTRTVMRARGSSMPVTCWVSRGLWLPPVEGSGGWRTLSGPTALGSRTARPPGRFGGCSNRFSGRGIGVADERDPTAREGQS
jgi:hypothetical protein